MNTCHWPVDRTCLPAADPASTEEQRAVYGLMVQEACDTAVGVLWALTGRQFCAASVLARPCPGYDDVLVYASGPSFRPVLDEGAWRNIGLTCGSGCQDRPSPNVVHLPGRPISVDRVTVEGTVIDPSGYRLEGHRLYRTGGHSWPMQNLQRPAGEQGTWTVEYVQGTPPPAGAARAVGELAGDFLSACMGGKCRLPRRVTNVQRQGVSVQMVDPTDLFATGATGIPTVDLWVRAINPHRITQPARVLSPDYNSGG